VANGRDNAERNAECHRHQQRGRAQFHRDRQALDEQLRDRAPKLDRIAEITTDHFHNVDAELHRYWPIQPMPADEFVADGRGGALAQGGTARIARQQSRQSKGHEEDAQQDRNGQDEAMKDIAVHAGLTSVDGALRGDEPARNAPSTCLSVTQSTNQHYSAGGAFRNGPNRPGK
jgi:hypothetical protein